jgi:hypothetical protein
MLYSGKKVSKKVLQLTRRKCHENCERVVTLVPVLFGSVARNFSLAPKGRYRLRIWGEGKVFKNIFWLT